MSRYCSLGPMCHGLQRFRAPGASCGIRRVAAAGHEGEAEREGVVQIVALDTLAGALSLRCSELVAMVGAGGKTSALCLLARELAAAESRVIVTTTTAMFLRELTAVGPVVIEADEGALTMRLRKALAKGRVAGAAFALARGGKVIGLQTAFVDRLWAEDLADYLIVEADGSRGRPLKAFASDEPQVPPSTTTIVQVAGLDAIGSPLSEEYVHRAEAFAMATGTPQGARVTTRIFAAGLLEQVRLLREAWASSRVVTLLNKADGPDGEGTGLDVARLLTAELRQSGSTVPSCDRPFSDAVVVASLRNGRFALVCQREA